MKWDRGRVPFLLLLLPLLAMVATAGTKASKGKEGRKSASIGTTNALTTLLRDALTAGPSDHNIATERTRSDKVAGKKDNSNSLNRSALPPGCNPATGRRCRDRVTGLLPPGIPTNVALRSSASNASSGASRSQPSKPPRSPPPPPPPPPGGSTSTSTSTGPPPVPETACEAARDPTLDADLRFLNGSSTEFRLGRGAALTAAAAAATTTKNKTEADGKQRGHGQGLMVFHSGGTALGNALLGYLTSFHDALRSSRRLLLHPAGVGLLHRAFDLGVPFASPATLSTRSHRGGSGACQIFFDYARYPPAFRDDIPAVQTYLGSGGMKGPRVPSCFVAHSRPHNFHFDRSKRYPLCYFAALGCPPPPGSLNTAKQNPDARNFCGESYALRRLLAGPSAELKRLGAAFFASRWNGDPARLFALLHRSGDKANNGGGAHSSSSNNNLTGPIWSAAIHARVQFPFVEAGLDERDAAAVEEVQKWLAAPGTRSKLERLVGAAAGAGKHDGGAVYVASETALVRRHIADMLRARGTAADYFMHSGRAHPVNNDKSDHQGGGSNYGARFLPFAAAKSDEARADALFPYLEWWALAHARLIHVKRHVDLRDSPSTYSGTAHLYGGWHKGADGGRIAHLLHEPQRRRRRRL